MAKLALLFIAVFCIFSIALASRIPRDTATPANDISKQLETAWQSLTTQMENVLSKENFEKLTTELKEFGDKIKTAGQDLVAKIEENTKQ